MRRKLAHFRRPEETSRGWPGDARVITPGPSRTVQFHAIEEIELPYGVPRKLQNGGEGFPAEYAAQAKDYGIIDSVLEHRKK